MCAGCLWDYVISVKLNVKHSSEGVFEQPEQAIEAAIKYCLENMI